MNVVEQLKSLLHQAELYRSQGLFRESREMYANAARVIQSSDRVKNKTKLIQGIARKLKDIDADLSRVEKAGSSTEMTPELQDLVKRLFSFSKEKTRESAALEGAIALAKFGQYQRAIEEFNQLIKFDSFRVTAAKNIIRCYMAMQSIDRAVEHYRQWLLGGFPSTQLEKIRLFFETALKKNGAEVTLPCPEDVAATEDENDTPNDAEPRSELPDEDILDINSIEITFDREPIKGKQVEFDVSFQSGNVISILIPSNSEELITILEPDYRLNSVQFYSPIAIFSGTGIISAKNQITSGPRRGDYSVDIKVLSI